MKNTSIFNEVLGPVMRGPSSSHTAASYHLARLVRSLLGDEPVEARFIFDPDGSYGNVYKVQGSDLAFAAGLLDWSITDGRFNEALDQGLNIDFSLETLPEADHPNTVKIQVKGKGGESIEAVARSIGGGSIEITSLEGWPVLLTGKSHTIVVEVERSKAGEAFVLLHAREEEVIDVVRCDEGEKALICMERRAPLPSDVIGKIEALRIWIGEPVFFVKQGAPLFSSAEGMVGLDLPLGEAALKYESQLLGLTETEILEEMVRRIEVMRASVTDGLVEAPPSMQLLRPTAGKIYAAEAQGKVAKGGMHTRAAARAMAAMTVNCGMGVVCAAPTAGSAGVLPAVAVTLEDEMGFPRDKVAHAMLAAGAVGVILSERATFAAEIAGCQVEIGAAGAMAAAAVVDAAGGTVKQAADAAAISFQNTMGSVCDLVQGIVEIPCHTRNAVAASSAFVCADLILGGYENAIGLDETIDAVFAVGKMLPQDLKVTARGGLALAPSAKAMKRMR